MSWTIGDWLQLWTAVAVTGGMIITGLLYSIARRQGQILSPTVSLSVSDGPDRSYAIARLAIDPANQDKWQIARVRRVKPRGVRMALPIWRQDELNKPVPDGPAGKFRKQAVFYPPASSPATLVLNRMPPSPLNLECTLALRANPRLTSRCTIRNTIGD